MSFGIHKLCPEPAGKAMQVKTFHAVRLESIRTFSAFSGMPASQPSNRIPFFAASAVSGKAATTEIRAPQVAIAD